MVDVVSRYSYILFAAVVLGLVAYFAVDGIADTSGLLILLGVLALLVTAWVWVYRGETPPNPDKRLKKVIGRGRPVLVHFYSDWCLGSMLKAPFVNRLARRFKGRIEFVFISMGHREGRETAQRYESGTGGFILYDSAGQEVARGGSLPSVKVLGSLARPR